MRHSEMTSCSTNSPRRRQLPPGWRRATRPSSSTTTASRHPSTTRHGTMRWCAFRFAPSTKELFSLLAPASALRCRRSTRPSCGPPATPARPLYHPQPSLRRPALLHRSQPGPRAAVPAGSASAA
jgi:hypothetical protein